MKKSLQNLLIGYLLAIGASTWAQSPVQTERHILSASTEESEYTISLDVDADGLADIISTGNGNLVWYKNDGNMSFTAIPIPVDASVATISDLNQNDTMSLIAVNTNDGLIIDIEFKGYDQTEVVWQIDTLYAFTDPVWGVATGYIDEDEYLDIAFTSFYYTAGTGQAYWLKNNGDNTFEVQPEFYEQNNPNLKRPWSIRIADINNDTRQDIVIASVGSGTDFKTHGDKYNQGDLSWFGQETDGSWTHHTIKESDISQAKSFAGIYDCTVADLDNDGDLDVIGASTYDGRVGIFYNEAINPDGSVDFSEQFVEFNTPYCVRAADIDLDGDIDIVSSSRDQWAESEIAWIENPFTSHTSATAWNKHRLENRKNRTLGIADFNNDGTLDIHTASNTGFKTSVFTVNVIPRVKSQEYTIDEDSQVVIDFDIFDDHNIVDTILSYTGVEGSIDTAENGEISFVPTPHFHGNVSMELIAIDNAGAQSLPAEINISVLSVNDIPVAGDTTIYSDADGSVTFELPGTDADTDAVLTYYIQNNAKHGSATIDGHNAVYECDEQFAVDSFSYYLKDETGAKSNYATVYFTKTDFPVTEDITTQTIEDIAVSFPLKGLDQEGGVAYYEVSDRAVFGIVEIDGDIATYTPNPDFNGTDQFTYIAVDVHGAPSLPSSVDITVKPANDAPVADDLSETVNEDASGIFTLMGSDMEDGLVSDFRIIDSVQYGYMLLTHDAVSYISFQNYNGTDSFTYVAIDNDGAESEPATVNIEILSVNDIPLSGDTALYITKGDVISFGLPASDVDGTVASYNQKTIPSMGFVLLDEATATYTQQLDMYGEDSFTYTVTDNDGAESEIGTVTIHVTDFPLVQNTNFDITEDEVSIVWMYATDARDGIGSYTIVDSTTNGTVELVVDSLVQYKPDPNFTGTDSFTFYATDKLGAKSEVATVTITVLPVNDEPVAEALSVITSAETEIDIQLMASDSDGTIEAYTIMDIPSNGTATLKDGGVVTYTPAVNYTGTDMFTYQVADDQGAYSELVQVTIVVTDIPQALSNNFSVSEDIQKEITLFATDDDGIDRFEIVDSATNGTLKFIDEANGDLIYIPALHYHGDDSFTFVAYDIHGAQSSTSTIELTVNPVNDQPVAQSLSAFTGKGLSVSVLLEAEDIDDDGSISEYIIVEGQDHDPKNGSVSLTDSEATYTPNADFIGTDFFYYVAADNLGLYSDTVAVEVSIANIPVANDIKGFTDEDVYVAIYPDVTDEDGEDDIAGFKIVEQPEYGTAEVMENLFFIYTPFENYAGEDTFKYTVIDQTGLESAPADVVITINSVNDKPIVESIEETITLSEQVITLIATDVDGDEISYVLMDTVGIQGAIEHEEGNGVFTYSFKIGSAYTDQFAYKAIDAEGVESNVVTITLLVDEVNLDADKDGVADIEDCDSNDPEIGKPTVWFADIDEDGYGDPSDSTFACSKPDGFVANKKDICVDDPEKFEPGECGCGIVDGDDDNDGVLNCEDECPFGDDNVDANEDGIPDACSDDVDNDGVLDFEDCDPTNDKVGKATRWFADADNDGAGNASVSVLECEQPDGFVANSDDLCDNNPQKTEPGVCGCDTDDADDDNDGVLNCNDICDGDDNIDTDNDGIPDACDVIPSFQTTEYVTICEGESYQGFSTNGEHTLELKSVEDYDSTVTIHLTVNVSVEVTENVSICQGGEYLGYNTATQFKRTLDAANGCDSIVTTNLSVLQFFDIKETVTICQGEEYEGFSTAGTHTLNLKSVEDCDSIVTIELIVLEPVRTNETVTICQGESYEGYSESTTFERKLDAVNGCDSIVETNLIVAKPYVDTVTFSLNQGETTIIADEEVSEEGYYADSLLTVSGCDSVIVTQIIINLPPVVGSAIEDFDMELDELPFTEELVSLFSDPEGAFISFATGTSQNGVVRIDISEQTITIAPVGVGSTVVTITATDELGAEQQFDFEVTVLGDTECTKPQVTAHIDSITCADSANANIRLSVTGGEEPYAYRWSNTSTDRDLYNVASGTYSVVVSTNDGCSQYTEVTVISPQAVTVTADLTPATCGNADGEIELNISGGKEPYSISWANGEANTISSDLSAGLYGVTVSDVNSCKAEQMIELNELDAPVITVVSVESTLCSKNEGSIEVAVTGGEKPYAFEWEDGSTVQNRSGLEIGDYTLQVTDNKGCKSLLYESVQAIKPEVNPICVVTVNAKNENIVVWEKLQSADEVANYRIYRESTAAGVYESVGTIAYDELSIFTDKNADPNIRPWRYKLVAEDACGNQSPMSPEHKTIHVMKSPGINDEINLRWNLYEGRDLFTYKVYRITEDEGREEVAVIPANITSYTDYNPPIGTIQYQIAVELPEECAPNSLKSDSGPFSQSMSNLSEAIIENSIALNDAVAVSLSPNPASKVISIVFEEQVSNGVVKLYNTLGVEVLSKSLSNTSEVFIDVSSLPAQNYSVIISTNNGSVTKPLVIVD